MPYLFEERELNLVISMRINWARFGPYSYTWCHCIHFSCSQFRSSFWVFFCLFFSFNLISSVSLLSPCFPFLHRLQGFWWEYFWQVLSLFTAPHLISVHFVVVTSFQIFCFVQFHFWLTIFPLQSGFSTLSSNFKISFSFLKGNNHKKLVYILLSNYKKQIWRGTGLDRKQ